MAWKYSFEEKDIGPNIIKVYTNRPQTVFGMFHESVKTFPLREAIKYGEVNLTYAELNHGVDELASALKKNYEVKKGQRVALFLKNDDVFPVAFLAVSKLGAVSVILNTRLTKPELTFQIEKTSPSVAIFDSEIWDKGLNSLFESYLDSNTLKEIWGSGGTCLPAEGDEEDLHTILFTSGTTGQPKGVRIINRNFIHSAMRLEQYIDMLGLGDSGMGRKTLIVAPLFHVMALQEQFIPTMHMAGTLVMLSALNITAFLELVEKKKLISLSDLRPYSGYYSARKK